MQATGFKCMKTFACKYCGSELLGDEHHGSCCNNGKTFRVLQENRPLFFENLHDDLMPLYTANQKNFTMHTRQFNNSFSFSSMGTTGIGGFDTFNNNPIIGGNVCVNGRTFHRIFHCNDSTHRQRNNPMKWYLIDPMDRHRNATELKLDDSIYTGLHDYILNHNNIAREITKIPLQIMTRIPLHFRMIPHRLK